MKRLIPSITMLYLFSPVVLKAQDVNQLVDKVKIKIEQVKDYTASGKMKTNVTFLKVPVANVVIYFKDPTSSK